MKAYTIKEEVMARSLENMHIVMIELGSLKVLQNYAISVAILQSFFRKHFGNQRMAWQKSKI
jgi:hypothetical protein